MKIIKIMLILFAVALFLLALGVLAGMYLLSPVNADDNTLISFNVQSGSTLRTVANNLMQQNLIRSDTIFYLYGRLQDIQLKAGVFNISPAMSVQELCAILQSTQYTYVRVSVPEGLTISKIAALLETNGVTDSQSFIDATKNPSLLQEFGIPSDSFEGYLFPDTYNFDPDMAAPAVVRMMVKNFFSVIEDIEILQTADAEELHNTVILASVVEREYRRAEEAPFMASVFSNRLKRNIGLYSCATIVYIITEIEGRAHPDIITYADTQIDNPYNTYKWAGLPPGPISNPGKVALTAAAYPADTNYYYFRLTDAATGTHVFTADFDEHIEAGIDLQTKNIPDV
ncbi:MAG: endolytic transglycosylase MltG [Spirochaetales bacterium]